VKENNELGPIEQIRELWPILGRRKWIILLASALLSATTVIMICLLPDWYTSSITILVDPQKIADHYAGPDSVTMDQLRYDMLAEQVLATPRLERVISEMKLYPQMAACMPLSEVADHMRKYITLQVHPGGDRNAGTFTITYKGRDPKTVANVAARLADDFIQWNLTARQRQAEGASGFVSEQLVEAKQNLEEEENKLKAFKAEHLGELPEQLQPNASALARLEQSLQANADRVNRLEIEKASLGESQTAMIAVDTQRGRLLEQKYKLEQELEALRARYSDEHPDVLRAQQRLAELQQQLSSAPGAEKAAVFSSNPKLIAIESEIKHAERERQELNAQIAKYQSYVEIAPIREQQFADLSRDYQAAKAHYDSLEEKSYSAGVAVELERKRELDRFSVLEPATVPQKPVKPNRRLMVMAVIPLCFLFSAGTVVAREKVMGKICTERMLRSVLPASVNIVGRIPAISTPRYIEGQRVWAAVSILGLLLCCAAVSAVLIKVHPHF